MFAFLLSVGILISVVSMFAIGFGIPNNGFDLGNTLIIAGTSGLGAGLVLIGLAACVRELRRLSDAFAARAAARPVRGLDQAEAQASASLRGAQSPRLPYAAKPGQDGWEPGPIEPRLKIPSSEAAEDTPAERPRPNIFAIARAVGEPPMANEPDPVPLSARGTTAPSGRTSSQPAEPAYEPKFGPADILARLGGQGRGAGRGDANRPAPGGERPGGRPAAERMAEPAPPERGRGNLFESMRPTGGKPARAAGPDTIARVSKPEPKPDTSPEPRVDMREPSEPPVSDDAEEAAPPSRPAADARSISILKSGVIDGMAYTLYTDGSIEAQLPQGTMRFASIEELRAHLEQHDRA